MNVKISRNAFLYIIFNLLVSFNSGIFNMFTGIYLKEKGFDEAFVGNMLSVNNLSLALCSIFGVYFIGKIGRKKNFALSSLAMGAGMVLIVLTDIPAVILLAGVICGFGLSLKTTGEAMFLSENSGPSQRILVFSLNFTAFNLGWAMSNFFGGMLSDRLKLIFGYNYALVMVILLGASIVLLSLIPVYKLKDNRRDGARGLVETIHGYKVILTGNRHALMFLLFYACIGLGAGMVVPFFSVYLKYMLKIDDGMVGTIMAIAQIGTVIGGMIIPFLSSKIGVHKSIVLSQLLSIPFLISIAFPSGLLVVILSFFIRSSLMNMSTPLVQNLGMEMVHPLDRANLSSLMTLFNNLARAIGIAIGGYIMHRFSYNTPYYFTVFFYLLSTVIFVSMYKDSLFKKKDLDNIEKAV